VHLRAVLGDRHHPFRYGDGAAEEDRVRLSWPLAQYLDAVFIEQDLTKLPTPPSRTEKIPYARHVGPLLKDSELAIGAPIESLFPEAVQAKIRYTKFLFLGAAGTKTNNHYDWTHNFVSVMYGVKHVALMPPNSHEHFQNIDETLRAQLAQGECFFVEEPDNFVLDLTRYPTDGVPMHKHPIFACPGLMYTPLFPGEVVFFPAYWYHYFHNVEASITTQTRAAEPICAKVGQTPALL
jgi:hypothetical protein